MGKYERRTRQGIMMYREDMSYLTALADDELASIVRFLADASAAVAEGQECPAMPLLCGFAEVTCKNMLDKLLRDHDKYIKTCESRRPKNQKGDLSMDKEGKGDFGTLTERNVTITERSSSVQNSPPTPTVLQVQEYCKEQGLLIDVQRFHDYYSMKGWPVEDWRAAARYWASTVKQRDNQSDKSEHKHDAEYYASQYLYL